MILRLIAAVALGILIGAWLVLSSLPAKALGYPIPQPKGCPEFWDSKKALHVAKHHPFSSERYLSDPHFLLFGTRDGGGVMFTHNEKGCLKTFPVAPWHAAKLLTKQGDA